MLALPTTLQLLFTQITNGIGSTRSGRMIQRSRAGLKAGARARLVSRRLFGNYGRKNTRASLSLPLHHLQIDSSQKPRVHIKEFRMIDLVVSTPTINTTTPLVMTITRPITLMPSLQPTTTNRRSKVSIHWSTGIRNIRHSLILHALHWICLQFRSCHQNAREYFHLRSFLSPIIAIASKSTLSRQMNV